MITALVILLLASSAFVQSAPLEFSKSHATLQKSLSQPVYAFSVGQNPTLLNPGVPYKTNFDSTTSVGSQFAISVPQNVSRVYVTWSRSASSDTCSSSTSATLYAKWGTFPCDYDAYDGLDTWCADGTSLGSSTGAPLSVTLNAFKSQYLSYWKSPYETDFIRGDYLYFASSVNSVGSSCTGTINVTFDSCPENTIAAESTNDTQCVDYTAVTGTKHTESVVMNSAPFQKYWLVTVPQNCSGVRATVTNYNSTLLYVYGRVSSGGSQNNYYQRSFGSGNLSLWSPNVIAGQYVVSVVSTSTGLSNIKFDITIEVFTCPNGFASNKNGNCTSPLIVTSTSSLSNQVTVAVSGTKTAGVCNWKVYGFPVPAWTRGFLNLTIDEMEGTGWIYIRKNAWPTEQSYDDYSSTSWVWNFTPEDFYTSKPTWYYIGFCNDVTTSSSWTMKGTYKVPSAAPSPSVSPSPGTSAAPVVVSPSASAAPVTSPTATQSMTPSPIATPSDSPATASSSPESNTSPSSSPEVVVSPSSSPDATASVGSSTPVSVIFLLAALVLVL